MSIPVRIRRRRVKGFNLQQTSLETNGLPCVYVGRPTIYGNQFGPTESGLWLYEKFWREQIAKDPTIIEPLRNNNLSCFCSLDRPCHVDILFKLLAEV